MLETIAFSHLSIPANYSSARAGRNQSEYQILQCSKQNPGIRWFWTFKHLNLDFVSSFVLRISDLLPGLINRKFNPGNVEYILRLFPIWNL